MSIKIETTELDKLLTSEDFEHLSDFLSQPTQGSEDLLELVENFDEDE